ncbi:MAG TPA: hypothetical protein VKZ60_07115 [Chloroflexota bacterium]|jgi:hypothetical protein|nr:hypothetical protein [Chloroflexota bacterium]
MGGRTGFTGARLLLPLVLLAAVACAPATGAPPGALPTTPRAGYDRLQEAYTVWQLVDRAREATARLHHWRELDVTTGSWWEYSSPNIVHYQFVGRDGQLLEGYESEETACWRRADGQWDRRAISRRPPAAPALADDLFTNIAQIIPEGQTDLDGTRVQVVRLAQRAGERRWSTLASDRELRLWIGLDDALPRRVEIARPTFRQPEYYSMRLLSDFDQPGDLTPPCS